MSMSIGAYKYTYYYNVCLYVAIIHSYTPIAQHNNSILVYYTLANIQTKLIKCSRNTLVSYNLEIC